MAEKIVMKNGQLQVSDRPIIPFIEGDGVGHDIWKNAQAIFDKAVEVAYEGKRHIEWQELLAGKKAYDKTGEWLPKETLEAIRESLVAIKGPLETPVGGGIRSLNVALRQELDLYACVRPVRYFDGVASPLKEPEKTNITIFRENTEDIYAGIEWEAGTADVKRVIEFLQTEMNVNKIRFPESSSIGIKPISIEGSKRLIRSAIDYALKNNLKKVTLVHKGNIQKFTEGGFRKWGYEVAQEDYKEELLAGRLEINDIIADNFLQQILLNPEKFDVVALTNLNGDYASDALAAQVGGIGISPGANINYKTGHAIFEATHGTAPDIADQDKANPCSVLLSDTAQLNKKYVKAFVTNIGGRTSHSAIMARTLEIAAVLGTNNITELVKDGDILAVSGITGEVVINPTEEQIAEFKAAGEAYAKQKAEWALLKDAQTVTADGKHFELAANIGTPKDVEGVNDNGAEAVGLYRTEFLYMDSQDFPTEDDQYEAYKAVLEGMNGKPVVVRTMDIGGDKELPYFDLPKEMNPFLGFRALRISISETGNQMFRTQLRALLRASVHGKLRIMFPMVALLTEFRTAKGILEEEKAKLVAEGVAVADDIEVGIMIEIPAAAMLADQFAKEVDFFSIGTNDLIQYTMAADRMNEQVSYLYQPYNPSILRLINNVIKAAHAEGKWAGMCGEMAGDQTAVPLLVGMGLDEFSMSATSVLRTRSLMKKLDTAKMEEYANRALTECSTMEEVLELSKEYVNVD